ncbi:MAG: FAD-dependent oxidoreductase [Chitinophagaceae bacterium]|nr:MAG: FAD-dependent oxidoreductase [Chitinophagaceae bacterium]
MVMEQKRVIIVGAGIAGLTLARELSPAYDVLVLEAQERTGGRIHTVLVDGNVVERGAEFIHGRLPATLQLAREAGATVIPADGRMYRRRHGRLAEEDEMISHWDSLLEKMGQVEDDLTLTAFLDKYFYTEPYGELRKQAFAFAGGFDLADADHASVRALYREWSADQEPNFRLREGYGKLIDFLQQCAESTGVTILLNTAVTTISIVQGKVIAGTDAGREFAADALVVTVPVGPIAAGSIRFDREIAQKTRLVTDIGMGTVIRFVLGFRRPLWPADTGFLFSDELVPTWWTGLQEGIHQLVGWAGGAKASALSGKPEELLVQQAVSSLATILGLDPEEVRREISFHVITDWSQNPWSIGGYSYATPLTEQARTQLNQPLADRIWFAGEGYSMGDHPGTVEAAIVHATHVAESIRTVFNA